VTDTGSGITPATLDLLFRPFTQGDSTLNRSFEGARLGLAISTTACRGDGRNDRRHLDPRQGQHVHIPTADQCGARVPSPPFLPMV